MTIKTAVSTTKHSVLYSGWLSGGKEEVCPMVKKRKLGGLEGQSTKQKTDENGGLIGFLFVKQHTIPLGIGWKNRSEKLKIPYRKSCRIKGGTVD